MLCEFSARVPSSVREQFQRQRRILQPARSVQAAARRDTRGVSVEERRLTARSPTERAQPGSGGPPHAL